MKYKKKFLKTIERANYTEYASETFEKKKTASL